MFQNTLLYICLVFSLSTYSQLSPYFSPHDLRHSNKQLGKQKKNKLYFSDNGLPNIILLGYWYPTNMMIRDFNANPKLNPKWIGENWEGRGYNIYSFSPDFPYKTLKGVGDFTVDYQSSFSDFWRIMPKYTPVAILSFGRAKENNDWEIESIVYNNFNQWRGDFKFPYKPKRKTVRYKKFQRIQTAFPKKRIKEQLVRKLPELNVFIDEQGSGDFLCEYMAYQIYWYQSFYPNMRYGIHTHIGAESSMSTLKKGLGITLRELILSL